MTKHAKKDREVLETVRQWEKVAHCPECGHTKCDKCAGVAISERENTGYFDIEFREEFSGPTPPEIRDKAVYCCQCGSYDHFVDWVALDHERLASKTEYDAESDDFDGRVLGIKRVRDRTSLIEGLAEESHPKPKTPGRYDRAEWCRKTNPNEKE